MVLSPSQKLITTSIIWVGIVGLLAYLFITLNSRIFHFPMIKVQTEAQLSRLEAKTAEARRLAGLFRDRQEDFNQLSQFFVDRQQPVDFIEKLENLGREIGVSPTLLADEGRSKKDSLFFQISAEGSESSLRHFLRALELLPYDLTIQEFSFERNSGANQSQTSGNTSLSRGTNSAELRVSIQVKTR